MKNYLKITFLYGSLLFAASSATVAIANEIENNKVITSDQFFLNAHKIYVVNDGKIVENGTHENLLINSKIYKSFYEKQLKKS